METHDRINRLIDAALSRGDRAAVLILQGRRRALMEANTQHRIRRTLDASRARALQERLYFNG